MSVFNIDVCTIYDRYFFSLILLINSNNYNNNNNHILMRFFNNKMQHLTEFCKFKICELIFFFSH